MDSAEKNTFPSLSFLWLALLVLNMDLAVWLDGARPPKSNVCNYIKIKIAEVYFNDNDNLVEKVLANGNC